MESAKRKRYACCVVIATIATATVLMSIHVMHGQVHGQVHARRLPPREA
jgi:hypothetical protein